MRRRGPDVYDETLIDLTGAPPLSAGVAGEALGLPVWDDEPDDLDDLEDLDGDLQPAGPAFGADDLVMPGDPPVATPPAPRFVPPRPAPRPAPPPARPVVEEPPEELDLAALVASVDDGIPPEPEPCRRPIPRRGRPRGHDQATPPNAAHRRRRADRHDPRVEDRARRRDACVQHGRDRMDAVGTARGGPHRDLVLPRRAGDRRRRGRRRGRDRQPLRRAQGRHDPRVQRALREPQAGVGGRRLVDGDRRSRRHAARRDGGGGRRGRRRGSARRAAGLPPQRRQQRRLRERHVRHVVPGRRVHGRRQPRSDRAHQPVRPDDRRLARVRHP